MDYENYLKLDDSLSFNKALSLYQTIMNSGNFHDEDFSLLWNDVIDYASEYVKARNEWALLSRVGKIEKDNARTKKHDLFMSSLHVLARYMQKMDWDASWHSELKDENTATRKTLGDFAGYLLLFGTLSNR